MTEKTKREREIEAAAKEIWRVLSTGDGTGVAVIRDCARCGIAEFERIMAADTITSPLADESTGGPEGGPGWEP